MRLAGAGTPGIRGPRRGSRRARARRARADHHPVALAHRQSEQPVPNCAADQVDSHGAHVNRDARGAARCADLPGWSRACRPAAQRSAACARCSAAAARPYVMQAAAGEWHVLRARVPIDTRDRRPAHTRRSCARSLDAGARGARLRLDASSACRTTGATAATPTSAGRTWCGTWWRRLEFSVQPAALVLSGGRLRRLPRLLQRTAGARVRRTSWRCAVTTSWSRACRPTRRSASSPTRCSRACCATARTSRGDHLPRAGAPAAVRARRHRVQRGVRHDRRG